MKRRLFAIIMVLTFVLSLCACGNSSKGLIGTWESSTHTGDFPRDFTFYEDNTGNYTVNTFTGTYGVTCKWSVDGNILTTTSEEGTRHFEYNIQGNQLTLTVEVSDFYRNYLKIPYVEEQHGTENPSFTFVKQ